MILIQSPSNSPTFNMATEEYLFMERQDDILFLYVNDPSVIIGSNQAVQNEVDVEFCKENNIQVARRLSGGGAVYHDQGNLNYCFISNRTPGQFSLDTDFLKPIIKVLDTFHIEVHTGDRKDLWLPGGHKISGTASHITKNRKLQHGTLLYDTNLDMLESALTSKSNALNPKAIKSVHSPVKNLRTYLNEQNHDSIPSKAFFELFTNRLMEYYGLDNVSFLIGNESGL